MCLRFNGDANSLIFYDHLLFQAAAAPAVGFKFSPTKWACVALGLARIATHILAGSIKHCSSIKGASDSFHTFTVGAVALATRKRKSLKEILWKRKIHFMWIVFHFCISKKMLHLLHDLQTILKIRTLLNFMKKCDYNMKADLLLGLITLNLLLIFQDTAVLKSLG